MNEKNADEFVDGENMDLLVGNRTKQGEEKEAVKAYIAQLLKDTYSIKEDFISSEFELVPAGKARKCGLDKSLILAYSQDDRAAPLPR